MSKDLDREVIGEEVKYRVEQEYSKYHNKTTFNINGEHYWIDEIQWKLANTILSMTVEQRQKDLKAISFHFGIPVKDLEKALNAKPFKDTELEVPESTGGD